MLTLEAVALVVGLICGLTVDITGLAPPSSGSLDGDTGSADRNEGFVAAGGGLGFTSGVLSSSFFTPI